MEISKNKDSLQDDEQAEKGPPEEEEANIHHVARVTFEGNPLKGQLSFITGAVVLAHSNQRGPWWLGRSGGRTGWFPASAVVPAFQFLGNNSGSTSCAVEEEEKEFARISHHDLDAVYDLIRSPSDPMDSDVESKSDDEDEGALSEAKNRWINSASELKDTSPATRNFSPPPDPRLDPSEGAGLSERLYETQDNDHILNANDLDVGKVSQIPKDNEGEPHINGEEVGKSKVDEVSTVSAYQTVQPQLIKSSIIYANGGSEPQGKTSQAKIKRLWRSAFDKNSGLTYYYNVETREVCFIDKTLLLYCLVSYFYQQIYLIIFLFDYYKTTWEKPPGFIERKSPMKESTLFKDASLVATEISEAVGPKDDSKISRDTVRKHLEFPAMFYIDRGFSKESLDIFDVGICNKKLHFL